MGMQCCIVFLCLGVWQFQMWIAKRQKHYRKSTRTRNLDEAIGVGKDIYLDIHSKLRTKAPIFPKTMREVVNEFLEQKRKILGLKERKGGGFVCVPTPNIYWNF
jgi:hypothetical protein